MKKLGLVLFTGILLISLLSFTSASCLKEILSDDATQLTATVYADSTELNFYLNTSDTVCDTLDVVELINKLNLGITLEDISIKFNISDFLEDIEFKASYLEGVDYIEFSRVYVNPTGTIRLTSNGDSLPAQLITELFNWMFGYFKDEGYVTQLYDINQIISNSTILTNLVKEYTGGMPQMYGNAYLEKEGNSWILDYDKGFNDLRINNSEWFDNAIKAIDNNESFTLNVSKYMLKTFSWARSIPYLEEGGDLILKVMPGELKVNDLTGNITAGVYYVPVEFTFNGKTEEKETILNLKEDIIVSVIPISKTQVATNGTTIVEPDTTTIVFNQNNTNVSEVIINSTISETKEITLDMSNVSVSGSVTTVNEMTLERDTSSINYTVTIPNNTRIYGNTGTWDGILNLPTVTSLPTSLGTTEKAIKIGSNITLNFTNAVKITLTGMTGRSALWSDGTNTYAIKICDSNASSTSKGDLTIGECYLDNGADLIIWTYHFTIFGAYNPTTTSSGGRHHRTTTTNNGVVLSDAGTSSNPTLPSGSINLNAPKGNGNGAGITGGVIGALTSPLFWMAIDVTVILGIVLIFLSRKKKREAKEIAKRVKSQLKEKEALAEGQKIFEDIELATEKEQETREKKSKKKKNSKKKKGTKKKKIESSKE